MSVRLFCIANPMMFLPFLSSFQNSNNTKGFQQWVLLKRFIVLLLLDIRTAQVRSPPSQPPESLIGHIPVPLNASLRSQTALKGSPQMYTNKVCFKAINIYFFSWVHLSSTLKSCESFLCEGIDGMVTIPVFSLFCRYQALRHKNRVE